jgi:hypothetical protein
MDLSYPIIEDETTAPLFVKANRNPTGGSFFGALILILN